MDVEFCRGNGICSGPRCVCSDPRTRSRLYECPWANSSSGHRHDWVSAKNILVDHIGISETELDHILIQRSSHLIIAETHNRQTAETASGSSLYELAKETQDQWRRMVEYAVSAKESGAELLGSTSNA